MSESISTRMRDINIEWLTRAAQFNHLFNTRWLGEGFFHLPGDMLAIQELVWRTRPECIVQTGVAAGGGILFTASMLELCGGAGRVVAIEPRLRETVKQTLQSHRLGSRIELIEGPSCAEETVSQVRSHTQGCGSVMVILDLTHTHQHVLHELQCYAEMTTQGNYVVVMDTIMEYLPPSMFEGKPYGKGNNPATAVGAFLESDTRSKVDTDIEDRVIMMLSPGGFLK